LPAEGIGKENHLFMTDAAVIEPGSQSRGEGFVAVSASPSFASEASMLLIGGRLVELHLMMTLRAYHPRAN
jgi:hypothetical protein